MTLPEFKRSLIRLLPSLFWSLLEYHGLHFKIRNVGALSILFLMSLVCTVLDTCHTLKIILREMLELFLISKR